STSPCIPDRRDAVQSGFDSRAATETLVSPAVAGSQRGRDRDRADSTDRRRPAVRCSRIRRIVSDLSSRRTVLQRVVAGLVVLVESQPPPILLPGILLVPALRRRPARLSAR